MKLFFLAGIAFLSTLLSLSAQEKVNTTITEDSFKLEQSTAAPTYFLSLGLNVLDNGNSKLPFNANEMSFKNPFFASIERRGATSNFAPVLSFSTNKLKIKDVEKFYFSVDAAALYYFDDYIFNNSDIETYVGLGLGRFFLEDNGHNTFNFIGGGRYWFSKNFAVSLQGIGKVGLKPMNKDVLSHYAYNVGIVWNSNSKKKVNNDPIIESPKALKESLIKDKEEVVALKESIIQDKEVVVALKESLINEKEVLVANNDKKEIVEEQSVAALPLEVLDSNLIEDVVPVDIPTALDYSGDWYIKITNSKDNSVIISNSLYSIYTPYVEDGTLWISDFKKGIWLQCKIDVNLAEGTFTATKQPNTLDKGTVTITEGKFGKKKGLSKGGNKVDKIYFKAEFSYDPGNILILEGHKSTGLIEDKY